MKLHFSLSRVVLTFVILDILLLAFWLSNKNSPNLSQQNTQTTSYPEVIELQGNNMTFSELKQYFTDLALKKGAPYAYQVLKIAPIPLNIDMHLMGHVVGDILYKQQGINGIKICTQDFRNACSHSIVVGLLLDKGEQILPDIAAACRQAPGGKGAYTMCYHGLGHGILAYTAYDLPKAIELCQKTGSEQGIQCIGGTIMETISGGDHDKALWTKQRTKYLKKDDPFYPCMASFMLEEAKNMCLTYLTPYLWEVVGADLGKPTPQHFEKAFTLCQKLSGRNQNVCYGSFGKEFTVLAQDRDIRKIEQMSEEQLERVYNWCELAKDEEGINACISTALSSLYWGGENNRAVSIRFCKIISNSSRQSSCFQNLISFVSYYISDKGYRESFCGELPESYTNDCRKKLIST